MLGRTPCSFLEKTLRTLNTNELCVASGGDGTGVAVTAIAAPMALSVSSGVTGGYVTGVGVGGVVTGVGVLPVTAVVVVAAGGAYIGTQIGNSAPVQNVAGAIGTWLGDHGIVW